MDFVFLCILSFGVLSGSVRGIGKVKDDEKEAGYWRRNEQKTLKEALQLQQNKKSAHSTLFFLGDGMGMTSVTSIRIHKGQRAGRTGEEEQLTFDRFPYVSLAKTYAVDRQTSDSANTATAYLCGVKANYGTLGVDGRVLQSDCEGSLNPDTHVSSILQWAQDEGKWTGFVTSTRVTHATPAGLYAHSAHRDWESSSPDKRCADIASQLVNDRPGKDIRVIMGGGRKHLLPSSEKDEDDQPGVRSDSRNLIKEWEESKRAQGASYKTVFNADDLKTTDPQSTDYLLGLFHNDHLPYVTDRHNLSRSYPTLPDMTRKAIEILSRSPNGYFLLVEGGKIDIAHHANWGLKALEEGVEFDEAIATALDMVDEDTLVVVTADHSHTFTIGGEYPLRGTPINGVGGVSDIDNLTFTTLGYHNGPGYKRNSRDRNLTQEEALDVEFRHDALLPTKWATHGAEDVPVYARGPHAHLFHGVHEQSYIPHAIGYAACIGERKDLCSSSNSFRWRTSTPIFVMFSCFAVLFHRRILH